MEKKHKYAITALILAVLFWFFDSSLHYFFYGEADFEVVPSDFDELWMRTSILILIIGFGAYVDSSVNARRKLRDEQFQLQLKLDDALTKLLGGFVSICSECKKIRNPDEELEGEENWQSVESYISDRSDITFSHGYCPECEAKFRKEIEDRSAKRSEDR